MELIGVLKSGSLCRKHDLQCLLTSTTDILPAF
jgi:hypothetical protein